MPVSGLVAESGCGMRDADSGMRMRWLVSTDESWVKTTRRGPEAHGRGVRGAVANRTRIGH